MRAGAGGQRVTCAGTATKGGDLLPYVPADWEESMPAKTTAKPAPVTQVDIFDLPAAAPAKPAAETPRRGGNVPAKPATYAADLTTADLAVAHDHYTAAGETAVVFGYLPGRETPAAIVLDPCHRVAADGTCQAPEKAIVSPVSGEESRLLARGGEYVGQYVTRGAVIAAPTTGEGPAAKVAAVYVVGHGLSAPVRIDLGARGARGFKSADTAHVTYCPGKVAHVLSLDVSVSARKDGTWFVSAKLFTGGRLPRTDRETLSLAAMAAGLTGDAAAAVAALADLPNARAPRKRAPKAGAK